MDDEQVAALLAKTEEVAATGQYELFKTTSHFDTTAKHPDWLGGDARQSMHSRHRALPRAIAAEQVRQLLASIDGAPR
jgi:hypothetical protein